MTKIVLADDHKILRQAIAGLLNEQEDVELVGMAKDTAALWPMLQAHETDILIQDISFGDDDGINLARSVKKHYPHIKIIILTMHRNSSFLQRAQNEKLEGYIVKDDAFEDLIYCINTVKAGGVFISPTLQADKQQQNQQQTLSPREIEVLQFVALGNSTKEISDRLNLSDKTIETHRRNIGIKLDLGNAADFARYAIKIGLIKP